MASELAPAAFARYSRAVRVPASRLFLLTTLLASCRPVPPAERFARELEGAYPESASPTGKVVTVDLVAAEAELPLVDGRRLKVWAYNGQVPGPTIRLRLGDTLRARFTNRLPQPTTVHWHGVRVPNGMDGVPHATQPPIEPGQSFTYEFTPKDAGTYWFHPHVRSSEQVERGLYGVLIVEDVHPPPYSRDLVWVLDDWLLDERGQVLEEWNTLHDLAHDGRWGNVLTVNGRTDTALKVASGERIRLRLLNASNGRVYAPDLGALDARIIAVDGLYLRAPISPAGLEISPGNRVDLDITFRGGESRVVPIIDRFYEPRPNHLADLQIDGVAAAPAPAFASPAHGRVPAWRGALAVPALKEFRLNARRGGAFGIEWTINGEAFAGHEHDHSMLTMRRGQFARLRFVNESARLHPIHLHGMFFKLLARNGAAVDEGFFRDTVLVHSRETIDIGVVPLDEGKWMMHCHVLEHAEAGMMTMFTVAAR
jgi:FtsP/CotA-like multicopper oxidase with cupredoxin domain